MPRQFQGGMPAVKRRHLLLSPLLLMLICSQSLAHEHDHEIKQALVTVDPNLLARTFLR
jgi:hypothetical protein